MKRVFVAVLLTVHLCVCAAVAQDSKPAFEFPTSQPASQPPLPPTTLPAGVPVLSPSAMWTMPHQATIGGMAVSPDGNRLYVSIAYSTIRLWPLMLYYWPEALSIVATALIVIAYRRIRRYPVSDGQPHCRRCLYQLTNLESTTCPECGAELTATNQIIGRPRRWLLALLLGLWALILWVALTIPGFVQREGSIGDWIDVHSPDLFKWATQRGWRWVTRHSAPVNAIVELDADTGAVLRTIDEHLARSQWRSLLVSPDGLTLVVLDHPDLLAFDVPSGRRLFQTSMDLAYVQATFDASDNTLVVLYSNWDVALFNARTGESRLIDRTMLPPVQSGHDMLVPGTSQILNCRLRWNANRQLGDDSVVSFWDVNSQMMIREWKIPEGSSNSLIPIAVPGGRMLAMLNGSTTLTLTEVTTGKQRIFDVPHWGFMGSGAYPFSADGRLMIVPRFRGGGDIICDLEHGTVVGAISMPNISFWPQWKITTKYRVFAITINPATGAQKIVVFDVADLLATTASEPD